MNIRYVRRLGASVLGLALAAVPHIAVCQQGDEMVAAIEAAFPDEQEAEVTAETDFEPASPTTTMLDKPAVPGSPRELSVPPTSNPYYPENIPAWIREPADYSADRHVIPVGSIPTADKVEADDWLDEQLLASLYGYIDEQLLEPGAAARMQDHLTADYIRTNLIDDPLGYTVQLQTSSGPLYQKWVQIVVSPEQRQQLREWHREAIQRERIVPLGLGVAGLLTLVGGFHLLVRRTAKAADKPRAAEVARRVELPVVKSRATKRACCGKMLPACLLAVPIVVAVAAVKRGREARQAAVSESIVVQSVEVEPTEVVVRDKVREIVVHADSRNR